MADETKMRGMASASRTAGDGWIGIMRQLLYYLEVIGADRDESGKFLVRGSVCSFLGLGGEDAEVVVGGDAEYFVGGAAKNLAAGLRSTSYGLGVRVI
jgi:formylmethanofuran dehydrogenase subunit C